MPRNSPRLAPSRLGTETPGDWHDQANCRPSMLPTTLDPNIFFPHQGERGHDALATCSHCPVTTPCLQDALAGGKDVEGIWGGTNQNQRKALLRGNRPAEDEGPRKPRYTIPHRVGGTPIKQQAIDLYREARALYRSDAACYRAVGQQLGVGAPTVGDWIYKDRLERRAAEARLAERTGQ